MSAAEKVEVISIYEKYGDFEFWHGMIYQLYLDMGDHPEISYHFIGVDLEWLSRRQAEFLVTHIGGPQLYKGPSIKVVHRAMKISGFQFDQILQAFRLIFIKNDIHEDDVKAIMDVISPFKGDIAKTNETVIDKLMIPVYRLMANKLPRSVRKWSSWARAGALSYKFNKDS